MLVGILFFASRSPAETPCDFKGISVGNKMSPAQLMSALGVTRYKTNPAPHRRWRSQRNMGSLRREKSRIGRLGRIAITPRAPFHMALPVKVDISFHRGLITKIIV